MLAPEPSKPKINGAFRSVRTASILICTMAVTAFGASMTSEAATLTFGAALGNFENPPTGSAGTGSALVTIDTAIPEMTVDVHFAGLGSPTTVAHIHCCVTTPDGNAMVATTTPTFPGFPASVTSGDYNATFDMMLASSYNPAFITAHGGDSSKRLC